LSETNKPRSRRDFLKVAGSFAAGAVVAGGAIAAIQPTEAPAVTETVTTTVTETEPLVTSGDINAFRSALERDGFIVQEGKFGVLDVLGLFEAGYLDSCYGNNPSTPYMILWMPAAPRETIDTAESIKIGKAVGNKFLIEGLQTDFKLQPNEAVVLVGSTPPPAAYFSYCSYLFSRAIADERRTIFASLGDTLNHVRINTSGTPNGADGNPFDQETIIVTTADKAIDARVRKAAQSAGYSSAIMNTAVIPSGLVKMGLEDDADTFLVLLRLAFFEDKEAGDAFVGNPGVSVFRLTPKESASLVPYGVQQLCSRGTGNVKELDLFGAVNDLRQAILTKYPGLKATELNTSIWLLEGFDAIQRGVNVIGENRDTTYLRTDEFNLGDDPDEFLIVYGVNHAATGKATYSNFGIYGAKILNGIGAVSSHGLSGIAETYIPGHAASRYLYAWKVARNSRGDPRCLEIPWGRKAHGIDLNEAAFVGFRAYVEKETKVGPFWSEILYDRAIKFGPSK
jgi:hypothetical protein